jgi:hypothetical protein
MKYIPGYEARYSVTKDGRIYSHITEQFLKTPLNQDGYPRVTLCIKGTRKYMLVHQAVLLTYIGPPNGLICRHLNGDPTDNHLENLTWGTPLENAADMVAHGRSLKGERNHFFGKSPVGSANSFYGKKHTDETKLKLRGPRPSMSGQNNPNSKLSLDDISEIHRLRELGLTQTQIASAVNTSQRTVCRILLKKKNDPNPSSIGHL